MNKISLIVTILNEENSIVSLLLSVLNQSLLPNEVIIVDGGSEDDTLSVVKKFLLIESPKIKIIVKTKLGNRSIGRNYAISLAKNNLIAITDAGCTLDKDWLKNLMAVYRKSKKPVIAGYYAANHTNAFQEAVVPYVLVMPNRINEENFLPATRSMLIEKNLFMEMGQFDQRYGDNEDYVFAKKLEKNNIPIGFAKNAIVYWNPRSSLKDFYRMIFRFARGDMYSRIVRPKVILIFIRYIIMLSLFLLSLYKNFVFEFIIFSLFFLILYSLWAIKKNIKYVKRGWYFLPVLQIISDLSVMHGSCVGLLK